MNDIIIKKFVEAYIKTEEQIDYLMMKLWNSLRRG